MIHCYGSKKISYIANVLAYVFIQPLECKFKQKIFKMQIGGNHLIHVLFIYNCNLQFTSTQTSNSTSREIHWNYKKALTQLTPTTFLLFFKYMRLWALRPKLFLYLYYLSIVNNSDNPKPPAKYIYAQTILWCWLWENHNFQMGPNSEILHVF